MKTLVSVACAAVAVAFLSACAAGGRSNATSTAAKSGSMYCHKERLYTAGSEMTCNWTTSVAEACRDIAVSSRISSNAVSGAPTDSTRCAAGQWLVQVTMK